MNKNPFLWHATIDHCDMLKSGAESIAQSYGTKDLNLSEEDMPFGLHHCLTVGLIVTLGEARGRRRFQGMVHPHPILNLLLPHFALAPLGCLRQAYAEEAVEQP